MRASVSFVALMALVGGCRLGYEQVDALVLASGGTPGSGGAAGSGVTGGSGGDQSVGGDAGAADPTGGTGTGASSSAGTSTATGGTAGSSTGGTGGGSGGTTSSGGNGGTSATGGGGGASGASAASGGSGGSSGGTGGSSSGAGGGGTGGASGSGAGGTSSGGAGGSAGGGGFAGMSSLGDCQAKTFNGKSYMMCADEISWVAARDRCAAVGMALVRVDDAAESQWLYDNAYDTKAPKRGMWIGASDQAVEGEWRWTDDTLFWLGDETGAAQNGLFAAWFNTREPASSSALDDCATLDLGSTLGWYNDRCTGALEVFACESL